MSKKLNLSMKACSSEEQATDTPHRKKKKISGPKPS